MAKINIVGVGPGSPDYVTPAARIAVQQSQLVIGAQRSLNLFVSDIKGEKLVLTAKNIKDALKHGADAFKNGKSVAFLSTGDPGFSGLLHTVLESGFFETSDITVIPGISSIQACAARLNISWDNTRLFTFHNEFSEEEKGKLVSAVQCGRTVILLPNSADFLPKDIATFLVELDVDRETPVHVCENITLADEKITSGTLESVAQQTFGSLCVMVIKPNTTIKC